MTLPNPLNLPGIVCEECGATLVRGVSSTFGLFWVAVTAQDVPSAQCPKTPAQYGVHGPHRPAPG
jgi:hypothetical protein